MNFWSIYFGSSHLHMIPRLCVVTINIIIIHIISNIFYTIITSVHFQQRQISQIIAWVNTKTTETTISTNLERHEKWQQSTRCQKKNLLYLVQAKPLQCPKLFYLFFALLRDFRNCAGKVGATATDNNLGNVFLSVVLY